jgi:hypothetical protein
VVTPKDLLGKKQTNNAAVDKEFISCEENGIPAVTKGLQEVYVPLGTKNSWSAELCQTSRVPSSGKCCCVDYVRTDISEEFTASILSVVRIIEQ